MLLRFEVSNHRSILDPVELSMIALDEDRAAARSFERLSERVLTVAGVYGPNASGKSSVLSAIAWLADAVRHSLRAWDRFVPRSPHYFGDGCELPSTFDTDLVVDGVRHGYRVEVDDSGVLYESLCSYPERRQRTLFEREGDEIHFRRGLSGAGATQELLTPTTLALSAATRLRDPAIGIVGRAIMGIGAFGLKEPWGPRFISHFRDSSRRLFLEEHSASHASPSDLPASRDVALELLRFADPAIDDVLESMDAEEMLDSEESNRAGRRRQLQFVHMAGDEPVRLEFHEESAGTQMWFRLLGPALGALKRGEVFLYDEIDASLHPRLSARLVELFQDPDTNPRGAQLIFTSHDTSLLGFLNRDEVWLTEKESDGATRLKALAEFRGERVRRSLNLERAYLQGRFGAIPDVDQADVRSALGLAATTS